MAAIGKLLGHVLVVKFRYRIHLGQFLCGYRFFAGCHLVLSAAILSLSIKP
jgi:hypothetical protein